MIATLRCAGLACGWPGHPATLSGLDAELPAGQLSVILGANGAGKSTLLRTLAGRLPPRAGTVHLGERPLSAWPLRAAARALAWLPQQPQAPAGLTPRQLAQRGRLPYSGRLGLGRDPAADAAAVGAALAAVQLEPQADRPLETLSGGEQRRAWLALVLAQGAATLLLDEPTAGLDPAAALALGDRLRALAGEGRAVVAVLHDVNLAARIGDQLLALAGGRLLAAGPPAAVLTPAHLRALYRIEAQVIAGPHGRPHVVALGVAAGDPGLSFPGGPPIA